MEAFDKTIQVVCSCMKFITLLPLLLRKCCRKKSWPHFYCRMPLYAFLPNCVLSLVTFICAVFRDKMCIRDRCTVGLLSTARMSQGQLYFRFTECIECRASVGIVFHRLPYFYYICYIRHIMLSVRKLW